MRTLKICLSVALCVALLGLGPLAAPGKPQPPPPPTDPAIVYTSGADLWVMDASGANSTRLLRGIGGVSHDRCSWAADGCRIVFTSNMNNTNGMYCINKDGSGLRWISQLNSYVGNDGPAWSNPNADTGTEWIAFSDFDLVYDHNLFLMLPDGSNRVQLSEPGHTEWYPSWAPDGQRLAAQTFVEYPNYVFYRDILIYELAFAGDPVTGYTVTVLSKTNFTEGTILSGMVLYSDWAHHGDSLAVVTRLNCAGVDTGVYGNIYRIDLVQDGPPVFTCILDKDAQGVGSSMLSWSEDDQWIVFVGSRRDSQGRIVEMGMYKMPADGSSPPQFIQTGGKYNPSDPDWRTVKCGQ